MNRQGGSSGSGQKLVRGIGQVVGKSGGLVREGERRGEVCRKVRAVSH